MSYEENRNPLHPVIVEFHCECVNDDLEEEKLLSIYVKFRNQEVLDIHDGCFFDTLYDKINVALGKRYGQGWYIDDQPEINRYVDSNEDVQIDFNIND